MDFLILASGIIKTGSKLLDAKKLENTLNEIKKSIVDVYLDMCNKSLAAALDSITVMKNSNEPKQEFMMAIHHMYEAFHSLYILIDKQTEKKSAFNTIHVEDFVKYKRDLYEPCCKLANLIYEAYTILDDFQAAQLWKKRRDEMYEKAKNIYLSFLEYNPLEFNSQPSNLLIKTLTMQDNYNESIHRNAFKNNNIHEISKYQFGDLKRTSKKYVCIKILPGIKLGAPQIPLKYYTYYLITDDGIRYINNLLDKLKQIVTKPSAIYDDFHQL